RPEALPGPSKLVAPEVVEEAKKLGQSPAALAALTDGQGALPQPVRKHLEEVDERSHNIAKVLELDAGQAAALGRILVANVVEGRQMANDAQVAPSSLTPEQTGQYLKDRALDAVRSDP